MSVASASPLDCFKVAAGILLNYYVGQFPIFQAVPGSEILGESGITEVHTADMKWADQERRPREIGREYVRASNIPVRIYLREVAAWLESEGLLRLEMRRVRDVGLVPTDPIAYQLTAKSLHVLGHTNVLGGDTISEKLIDAVKDSATDAGKSAISEIVGQIIGGFVKSFGS